MTAWEEIEHARSQKLVDEDGDPVELVTLAPLAEQEIAVLAERLAERLGAPLPAELVELLRRCGGLESVLAQVDFSGRTFIEGFEALEIFPHGLPIAHDGCGNFWVLDLSPHAPDTAPLYFACHDPPVILYQSPSLAHFVCELLHIYIPPHKSAVDDVHEDRLFDVWRKNPGTMSPAAALASIDPVLRDSVDELLRYAEICRVGRVIRPYLEALS